MTHEFRGCGDPDCEQCHECDGSRGAAVHRVEEILKPEDDPLSKKRAAAIEAMRGRESEVTPAPFGLQQEDVTIMKDAEHRVLTIVMEKRDDGLHTVHYRLKDGGRVQRSPRSFFTQNDAADRAKKHYEQTIADAQSKGWVIS